MILVIKQCVTVDLNKITTKKENKFRTELPKKAPQKDCGELLPHDLKNGMHDTSLLKDDTLHCVTDGV